MIVSFKFYVMNFVNFVIDFYSHITLHVSQVFASCTYNTSYSLLNIVHVIMWVFGLTNQVWNILWVLCKTDLLLEKKKGDCLKSKFWENWVLNLAFVKIISSHTHAFFIILQCFEERLLQILLIFKNSFFFTISINRVCFSINRNCI